jgi:hypothetical protein
MTLVAIAAVLYIIKYLGGVMSKVISVVIIAITVTFVMHTMGIARVEMLVPSLGWLGRIYDTTFFSLVKLLS